MSLTVSLRSTSAARSPAGFSLNTLSSVPPFPPRAVPSKVIWPASTVSVPSTSFSIRSASFTSLNTKCSFASVRASPSRASGFSVKTYLPFAGCFASADGAFAAPADWAFALLSASFLMNGERSRCGEASSASRRPLPLSFRASDADPETSVLPIRDLNSLSSNFSRLSTKFPLMVSAISGSPLRNLISFSALSSNRMSASRSRARRIVPSAFTCAPASLALSPSNLISSSEDAT